MLVVNPNIAARREGDGLIRYLPKLRAGESLYVSNTEPREIDAAEALTDLLESVNARLTDKIPKPRQVRKPRGQNLPNQRGSLKRSRELHAANELNAQTS